MPAAPYVMQLRREHTCAHAIARLSPPWARPAIRRSACRCWCEAGVDCFRLNFSHGGRRRSCPPLAPIRAAEARSGKPIGVFADLQGPKIRVGSFEGGEIKLRYGQIVTLEASNELGDDKIIRLPHPEIINVLEEGDVLKLDDGKMQLTVIERARHAAESARRFWRHAEEPKGPQRPHAPDSDFGADRKGQAKILPTRSNSASIISRCRSCSTPTTCARRAPC